MYNTRVAVFKFTKTFFLVLLLLLFRFADAQTTTHTKLPQSFLIKFITSTEKFEVNHATEFKHADLPEKYYDVFLSYIKDSVAAEIPGLTSIVYYSLTLKDGKTINGDIYWNDTKSYIVFKIDNKQYVNYFTREGVAQIKTIFKL
jgi:hypothetical protein